MGQKSASTSSRHNICLVSPFASEFPTQFPNMLKCKKYDSMNFSPENANPVLQLHICDFGGRYDFTTVYDRVAIFEGIIYVLTTSREGCKDLKPFPSENEYMFQQRLRTSQLGRLKVTVIERMSQVPRYSKNPLNIPTLFLGVNVYSSSEVYTDTEMIDALSFHKSKFNKCMYTSNLQEGLKWLQEQAAPNDKSGVFEGLVTGNYAWNGICYM